MTKVMIEIEIPSYDIKYCDGWNDKQCNFLEYYDDGFKQFCAITGKRITQTKQNGRICRPYGCRCLAKKFENK